MTRLTGLTGFVLFDNNLSNRNSVDLLDYVIIFRAQFTC
jgi:hypothetical protein